ncbi:DNA polymerase III subunit delta [Sphingomonas sp. BN140010]|uniref:DNA-directed DNA polymerase n=1 Tax=Sphingomonas arvum TaxID=2992113 RepID=A0ABT3JFY9_9SPHN|nr:DNA polymerase III subunit delta [Sphingomonas sp. BN140010]MCW3797726.1 DNA polymerase III subunit delta [Sphingomonas sp. BN140010]
MKVAKGAIDRTVDRPDPQVRFYLLYGEDEAGSRALAGRLLAALRAEKQVLASAQLRSDPAALADEAGAISMFGGPRLLWIEPAGEEVLSAVEALVAAPAVEHSAVAIAGALRKTSGLLKFADAHPAVLTHCSYMPDARNAPRLVAELGRRHGLRIGTDVGAYIAAAALNDQAVIGQELAKYALYLQADADHPKELKADLIDLLGAGSPDSNVGRAGDLALAGNLARLADELGVLDETTTEPIPVVRALQRRILQLAPLRARLDAGEPPEAVTKAIFWKDQPLVQRMLTGWSSERLAQVLSRLAAVERRLLQGGTTPTGLATLGAELLQVARARGH